MHRCGKEKVTEIGIVEKINPECSLNIEIDKKWEDEVFFVFLFLPKLLNRNNDLKKLARIVVDEIIIFNLKFSKEIFFLCFANKNSSNFLA